MCSTEPNAKRRIGEEVEGRGWRVAEEKSNKGVGGEDGKMCEGKLWRQQDGKSHRLLADAVIKKT